MNNSMGQAKTPSTNAMTTGSFQLQPLFDYVRSVPKFPGKGKVESSIYGRYQQIGMELTEDVPNLPGWYLWAKPNDLKPAVYVGGCEAGLRSGFIKSFNQEYELFWEAIWGKHLIEDPYDLFPQPKYRKEIEKFGGKSVSTHILWVTMDRIHQVDIEEIKRHLIQILNPSANSKRLKPIGLFDEVAEEVADLFLQSLRNCQKLTHSG